MNEQKETGLTPSTGLTLLKKRVSETTRPALRPPPSQTTSTTLRPPSSETTRSDSRPPRYERPGRYVSCISVACSKAPITMPEGPLRRWWPLLSLQHVSLPPSSSPQGQQ